ncbi:phosphopyruvate hydratase [Streptomyces himalayensis]|uniref:Enolase n=1 Tax=Streptomyces himalayensis subsp. himalayensis TaxID=2756131 RepID=A0A7W0ICW0_9ACTN|nr:phosphopyruvate hydratase [Streptomyces himalayensis]MBA2950777.1 phosphopyruvate hydratase [Streptomyces himalayensis subsp. himalayensis]
MTDARIAKLYGRRVWDSRGRPTVEVEAHLADGAVGRAIAPAGASMGQGEALDLRDGGSRFGGLDVHRAVGSVNHEIAPALLDRDATDQEAVDRLLVDLDGTPDRSRLGGNAIVATSMAILHAAAASAGVPLWQHLAGGRPVRIPLPEIQIFGGGAHADRRVDVQDFMVVCPAAPSFSEALDWTAEIYRAAGSLMRKAGKAQGVADEGGFWPAFDSNEEALETLTRAIEDAGFTPSAQVGISLDIAASQFGRAGKYTLALDDRTLDTGALIDMLGSWIEQYPILSVEDPVGEDDHEGMVEFTRLYGDRCQVIGDDYLVTNAKRVEAAATSGAANAVLVKPNQAGTVTESFQALRAGKDAGFGTIVSARSGETEDVTIAHLSVGWDAGQLKVGSFTRSERMAKWNEVLRIEESLGESAVFSGWSAFTFAGSGSSPTKP